LAPTFPLFVVTRASTGIDDSCYPGLYSLLSDYFGPRMRGKVYGLLQVAGPMGYMLGLILATTLGSLLGWRSVFFITGSVGILISALIFFSVREAKRGQAEPELADLGEISTYRIDRKVVVGLLGNQSLFAVFLGLTGLFMPFASPNVTATVHDVTKPEVRSTALAVQYFIEQGGSAVAPALAGLIAVRASLHTAIIAICVSTGFTAILVPRDIKKLRQAMRERAEQERAARVGLA